jgi:hypothetical protein
MKPEMNKSQDACQQNEEKPGGACLTSLHKHGRCWS